MFSELCLLGFLLSEYLADITKKKALHTVMPVTLNN